VGVPANNKYAARSQVNPDGIAAKICPDRDPRTPNFELHLIWEGKAAAWKLFSCLRLASDSRGKSAASYPWRKTGQHTHARPAGSSW
jgi:hypothetical protein